MSPEREKKIAAAIDLLEYHGREALATAIKDLRAENAMVKAENFRLAAGVCPMGFGDEGGTPRCCAEARIAELEKENAKLNANNREWVRQNAPGGWIDNLRAENAELAEQLRVSRQSEKAAWDYLPELEELRKDAARYHWLRHGDNDEEVLRYLEPSDAAYLPRMECLDALIDAAMSKKGKT